MPSDEQTNMFGNILNLSISKEFDKLNLVQGVTLLHELQ